MGIHELKYVDRPRIKSIAYLGPLAFVVNELVAAARLPSGTLQDDVAIVLLDPRGPEWQEANQLTDTDSFLEGLDVEWLAVDRHGQLGVFTTAGLGAIPKIYRANASLLEHLWDAIRALPEVSGFELLVTVPRPDDFILFAKRGLYSFDWKGARDTGGDYSTRYCMQSRPMNPITRGEANWSDDISKVLDLLRSPVLDFTEMEIDIRALLDIAG